MNDKDESLRERVQREQFASDETALYENVEKIHRRFPHVFSCPAVVKAQEYEGSLLDRLVPGATVLDYGCYEGQAIPRYLARRPSKLVGIDISEKGIDKARESYGDRADFFVADAHNLSEFDSGSFDLIVGTAILHHLDLGVAVREIHRLLRPGGSAIFSEPLGANPLGACWRLMTPRARTADETPLSYKDMTRLDRLFSSSDHYFFSIVSTPFAVLTSLLPLKPDNALLQATGSIDEALRRTPLRWGARSVLIRWIK